jgi:hypothetical protein
MGPLLGLLILTASAGGQEPVIDVHMHAVTSAARTASGELADPPCMPSGCVPFPTIVRDDSEVLSLALEAMDRNNIVLGIVSGTQLGSGGDLQTWIDARPGGFLAGAGFFDPASVDMSALRQGLEAGRIHVIGEMGMQYGGVAPDDPSLEPFYSLAEEYDVPVLLHVEGIAGGSPTGRFRIGQGHPERLQEVLVRHPTMRVWLENAGYPFLDEVIALMYRYPQVYVDVSTITWIVPRAEFYRYLKALMNAGLGNRVMWGSDQMNWPGAIDEGLDAIRAAPFLSDGQRRDILYNNAVRFFRLEDPLVG